MLVRHSSGILCWEKIFLINVVNCWISFSPPYLSSSLTMLSRKQFITRNLIKVNFTRLTRFDVHRHEFRSGDRAISKLSSRYYERKINSTTSQSPFGNAQENKRTQGPLLRYTTGYREVCKRRGSTGWNWFEKNAPSQSRVLAWYKERKKERKKESKKKLYRKI